MPDDGLAVRARPLGQFPDGRAGLIAGRQVGTPGRGDRGLRLLKCTFDTPMVEVRTSPHGWFTDSRHTLRTDSFGVWTNIFTAAGSTAAVVVAVGGAYASIRYGRRATVQVAAEAARRDGLTAVVVRVSVRAAGVFRLRFHKDRPCTVRVTEIWGLLDGLADGRYWETGGLFEQRFVEPGETLWTTELMPVAEPEDGLLGWRVAVYVTVARRVGKEWNWDDRVFVPRTG